MACSKWMLLMACCDLKFRRPNERESSPPLNQCYFNEE